MDIFDVYIPESEEIQKLNAALMQLDLIKSDMESMIDSSKKLNEKMGLPPSKERDEQVVTLSKCILEDIGAGGDHKSDDSSNDWEDECSSSIFPDCRTPFEIKSSYNKMLTGITKIKWGFESNLIVYDRLIYAQNRKAAEREPEPEYNETFEEVQVKRSKSKGKSRSKKRMGSAGAADNASETKKDVSSNNAAI